MGYSTGSVSTCHIGRRITPDTENLEARIDRERTDRERELYLLLLALFLLARRHAYSAVRIGADPFGAVTDVLLGNAALGLPGFAPTFARQLSLADAAGFRRTQLVLPGDGEDDETVSYFLLAAQYVGQMLATLHQRISSELAASEGGMSGARAAIRKAFSVGGYVESGPSGAWQLDNVTETAVGSAYYKGYFRGWERPEANVVTGFRYSAILDNRTTNICRAYDGVKLPTDHVWWGSHWPLNHFRCRSNVLPVTGKFTPTPESLIPWSPPPMPGFGQAPVSAFGRTVAA